MVALVAIIQKEHPEWFRESNFANNVGKKSWWLKAEYKGVFLQAARPHVDSIISRRPPIGRESLSTSYRLETNTQGLAGW